MACRICTQPGTRILKLRNCCSASAGCAANTPLDVVCCKFAAILPALDVAKPCVSAGGVFAFSRLTANTRQHALPAARTSMAVETVRSRSTKAGLHFPVGRISRYMRRRHVAMRIGAGAPVYLGAVLEYLIAEMLELAGNLAKDDKRSYIIPRHIQLAVLNDEELCELLRGVTIAAGGVLPIIEQICLCKWPTRCPSCRRKVLRERRKKASQAAELLQAVAGQPRAIQLEGSGRSGTV